MTDKIIYIGSYTEPPYAPQKIENGIYILRLQDEKLNIIGKKDLKNISWFLKDRNGTRLYCLTEGKAPLSGMHRFDIDRSTGELNNLTSILFPEPGACYMSSLREEEDNLLAIAFYDGGVVRTVCEDDTGRLHPHPPVVFHDKSGTIPDRQEAPHPHSVLPLESGDEFLVSDLGADALYKLRCRESKTRIMHKISMPPGYGPRHLLKHPKYDLLFVINELSNTLVVYETDGLYAQLTKTDEKSTLGNLENSYKVDDDPLQCAAHLQLSDCGKYVLVSNRGRHNSISVFRIQHPTEGKLELVETFSTHGYFPRFFHLIDDKYVLVANQLSSTILLFRFSEGNITGPIAELEIPNPAAISVL
uniref:Lactonase family protein n=2 Tax=Bursaphelenchus xylophilus TaxID=6326 RepID=A0A1I7S1E6_BURXY